MRGLNLATFGLTIALSACGGGGGGGTMPAGPSTPQPTPAPGGPATPAPFPCTGGCAYTLTSSPAGIAVTLDNVPAGTTPVTINPGFSTTPHIVRFINPAGVDYSVAFVQTQNGPHTIVYNRIADTGAMRTTGISSATRSAQSLAGVLRRPFDTPSVPARSSRGVYVRYRSTRLAPNRGVETIERTSGASGGFDLESPLAPVRARIVRPADGSNVEMLTTALRADPAVISVEPLHVRVPLNVAASSVNDPHVLSSLNDQWYLKQIGAAFAWTYAANAAFASAMTIAIIDTGIDLKHEDLPSAKIAYFASTVNAATSGIPDTSAAAAQDTNGHGTDVAGIAAAATNDGIGFAGVGYNARIIALRIFPSATAASNAQTADTGDEALAIRTAIAQKADVINLSLGAPQTGGTGSGYDSAEAAAVSAAIAQGISVVAAAGNESAATMNYPAAYDGVIAVGASAIREVVSGSGSFVGATEYVPTYSNAGPGLSIVAPGGDPSSTTDGDILHWIYNISTTTAAYAPDRCSTPPDCKALFAGTSQSTPMVSGTVALMLAAAGGHASLTPARIKAMLEGSADNIGDARQGHGRLNAYRAVAAASGDANPPALPPAAPGQFVAFGYTNSGAVNAAPAIADAYFLGGVPLAADGSFRVADVPATTGSFRIGVWLDSNGDGKVDAGDQFGSATVACSGSAPCSIGAIAITRLPPGSFVLP